MDTGKPMEWFGAGPPSAPMFVNPVGGIYHTTTVPEQPGIYHTPQYSTPFVPGHQCQYNQQPEPSPPGWPPTHSYPRGLQQFGPIDVPLRQPPLAPPRGQTGLWNGGKPTHGVQPYLCSRIKFHSMKRTREKENEEEEKKAKANARHNHSD